MEQLTQYLDNLVQNPLMLMAALSMATVVFILLAKAPEAFVAVLLAGPDFVQFAFRILGFQVTRRTFAVAGAVVFIPIVLLLVVLKMIQSREREPLIGKPNIPFLITAFVMGVVFLIGLTYTGAPNYGGQKTRDYFVFGMAPMLLAFVFITDRKSMHRLLMWILLVSAGYVVMLSAYSLMKTGSLFTQMTFIGEQDEDGVEMSGHVALSNPVVMSMAAVLAFAASRTSMRWRVLPLLVLPLAFFYNIVAGTRSVLVAFVFLTTVGLYYVYRKQRGILIVALIIFVISGVMLLAFAPQDVKDRILSSWVEEGTVNGYGGAKRIETLRNAPGQFLGSPIMGWGTGHWTLFDCGIDTYNYPHNMFVEVAVENGIIGLVPLFVLWGLIVGRVMRLLKTSSPGTELYGLAVFGGCMLALELTTALAHFGLAHHSCTFLLTSGITLRATYLAEREQEQDVLPMVADGEEPEMLVATLEA